MFDCLELPREPLVSLGLAFVALQRNPVFVPLNTQEYDICPYVILQSKIGSVKRLGGDGLAEA